MIYGENGFDAKKQSVEVFSVSSDVRYTMFDEMAGFGSLDRKIQHTMDKDAQSSRLQRSHLMLAQVPWTAQTCAATIKGQEIVEHSTSSTCPK